MQGDMQLQTPALLQLCHVIKNEQSPPDASHIKLVCRYILGAGDTLGNKGNVCVLRAQDRDTEISQKCCPVRSAQRGCQLAR